VIDRSLILLWRLRFVARLRRIRRSLRTPRGIVFFVVGCALFALWLLPSILGTSIGRPRSDPASVRAFMPLVLLAFTLAMSLLSGGKALSFSAADVDFLFPGPFSRHQLVLYKIAVTAFAALWVSLLFSIWQMRHATLWIAAFGGIWLCWLFAQSLAMLLVLARQAVTARHSPLVVRLAMGLLLALIIGGVIIIARPMFSGVSGFHDIKWQAGDSVLARIVLAPFVVLTRTFAAEHIWPDLILWAAISIAMIVALIAAILRLDSHFIESSLTATETMLARVRHMRSGGHAFGAAKPVRGLRIGMLPRMGGVGSLAWRQLMMALRGARGLLLMLLMITLGVGPMLWMASEHEGAIIPLLIMGGMWLLFILPSMVRFDFRGDLARMDALKALPLQPWAVAAGQMLAPVLVLTFMAWLIAAAVIGFAPRYTRGAAVAAIIAPAAIGLVVGLENVTFLMFPTAQTMSTPGDMSVMGRAMVVMFAKMIGLMIALGLAVGVAALVLLATGSWPLTLAAGWLLLAGGALATVPIAARLFATFDLSMDKPGE